MDQVLVKSDKVKPKEKPGSKADAEIARRLKELQEYKGEQ